MKGRKIEYGGEGVGWGDGKALGRFSSSARVGCGFSSRI